jgi:hypothetical protein
MNVSNDSSFLFWLLLQRGYVSLAVLSVTVVLGLVANFLLVYVNVR